MYIKKILLLLSAIVGLGLIPVVPLNAQIFTNLHSFTGYEGANPHAGLVLSGNTLYGTAANGGDNGNGSLFYIKTNGTGISLLYSFARSSSTNKDGANPLASLIISGNTLYGTTEAGGLYDKGTVFAIKTNDYSSINILHAFINGSDGANPYAGLILSGNTLYGTAESGGNYGTGTVFAINTNGTGFSAVYSFPQNINTINDGNHPYAGLILSGNTLYGTTFPALFTVQTNGTGFSALHNFTVLNGGFQTNSDGYYSYTSLILSSNRLYGSALYGGNYGKGTVFAINANGTDFTTLHSFTGGSDGSNPYASLIISGNTLYGTTEGGNFSNGTVFSINTDGTGFTTLYNFSAWNTNAFGMLTNSDGAKLYGSLILSGNTLYGTASAGGIFGVGTIFSISLPPPQLTITPSATNVVLSWPTYAPGVNLQFTTNLFSPVVWSAVSLAPTIVNGQSTVTNAISGAEKFYRLSQ